MPPPPPLLLVARFMALVVLFGIVEGGKVSLPPVVLLLPPKPLPRAGFVVLVVLFGIAECGGVSLPSVTLLPPPKPPLLFVITLRRNVNPALRDTNRPVEPRCTVTSVRVSRGPLPTPFIHCRQVGNPIPPSPAAINMSMNAPVVPL